MTVALYVRVSTPRQAHTQTIEQQPPAGSGRGEEGDLEPACLVFRDDGYRGATLRRPGLDILCATPCATPSV